jgi:hypothetical protein
MLKNPRPGTACQRILVDKYRMMRTLYIFLFMYFCNTVDGHAQQGPLDGWSQGNYSRAQADVFSTFSNLPALAEIRRAGIAAGGLKRPGLPELDVY